MNHRLPVHSDPATAGVIAAACQSLAGMHDFAEHNAHALQGGHSAGDLRGMRTQDYEALYAVAMALYGSADYERALPVSLALMAHEARSAAYSYLAGLCLHQLQRHREAAVMYLIALGQDAAHAPAALRLGECCAALGEHEAAQQAYGHAMELGRGHEHYRALQSEAMARLR